MIPRFGEKNVGAALTNPIETTDFTDFEFLTVILLW